MRRPSRRGSAAVGASVCLRPFASRFYIDVVIGHGLVLFSGSYAYTFETLSICKGGLQNFRFAAPASLSAFPVCRFSHCNISRGATIVSYFCEPRSGCGAHKSSNGFLSAEFRPCHIIALLTLLLCTVLLQRQFIAVSLSIPPVKL